MLISRSRSRASLWSGWRGQSEARRQDWQGALHNLPLRLLQQPGSDAPLQQLLALLQPLHHAPTAQRVTAERALNRRLEGGCQVPIACYAELESGGETLWLRGLVGQPDGARLLRAEGRAPVVEAEALGVAVAEDLLAQGAGAILAEVYGR